MTRRVHVVLSQGFTLHPDRRTLEEQLVSHLARFDAWQILVVPHLYDLEADGASVAALRDIDGDLIVFAWLYPRATHWVLDHHGIRGEVGRTSLDGTDSPPEPEALPEAGDAPRTVRPRPAPPRRIFCYDLRGHQTVEPYLDSLLQILRTDAREAVTEVTRCPAAGRIEEQVRRRWYPVIDFSRCTNCLECIDFCLFGVYGVDEADHVLVELPDHCRKGCPACSRVCPEQAIMFPQHKQAAIAGGWLEPGDLKMNLSDLFGAADDLLGTREIAVRERDEHLLVASQRPVKPTGLGNASGSAEPGQAEEKKDELDALIDRLDAMDV